MLINKLQDLNGYYNHNLLVKILSILRAWSETNPVNMNVSSMSCVISLILQACMAATPRVDELHLQTNQWYSKRYLPGSNNSRIAFATAYEYSALPCQLKILTGIICNYT